MNKLSQIIIDDAKNSIHGIDFSQLKNKTILITGASGLVGTYFLAGLKNVLSNKKLNIKTYAVCQSQPEKYWQEITKSFHCTVLRGDLCDHSFAAKLPRADVIIHAAGYGQPGKFLIDPLKTIKINTTVTLELLEKLKPNGKFLFISSSEVYSGLLKAPFKENQIGTTNTDHFRSCYIEGKRCGEAIIFSARGKNIDAKSARLSLAYGPGTRTDDKRAINGFIGRAITEKKIEMIDSGKAPRTYCYITDAVQIIWNVLLFGTHPVYNVGGFSRTTIAGLAKKIGKLLKAKVVIPKNSKNMVGAPLDVKLHMGKVKKEFKKNKNNYVSLDAGLKKTIEWQKVLYNKLKI